MHERPGIAFYTQYSYLGGEVYIEVLPDEGDCLLPDELRRRADTGGRHTVDVMVCLSPFPETSGWLELAFPFYSSHRWLDGLADILTELPEDMRQWGMQDVHRRLREMLPEDVTECHG